MGSTLVRLLIFSYHCTGCPQKFPAVNPTLSANSVCNWRIVVVSVYFSKHSTHGGQYNNLEIKVVDDIILLFTAFHRYVVNMLIYKYKLRQKLC